ncbi:MAG: 1-deoxy-D-xylulose-5-phosphate reductoisomerase [Peptostreptococcaceae bacterium]|nr:1-deoxy-D-xylulose-5-phosphate reductoisomerase [Peptostreptococcaceae bacterium]
MKEIIILGSTGSIGTQALDIVDENPEKFKVVGLSCKNRIEELKKQINKYMPKYVCVERQEDALELKKEFSTVEFFVGSLGLFEMASEKCDLLLNALMGISGLAPTYNAINNGTDIALANKETMVTGGQLITDLAKEKNVNILPVDSEHSAIFQCLMGNKKSSVKRLLITASGGPFRNMNLNELENVTLAQALKHPNWSMGQKITIDSATMMNKGLEVIEAKWLFDMEADKIDVLVHPESIVHSMVEYEDTSIIAQLGFPDMRIPIGLALNYPNRLNYSGESLDFIKVGSNLHFEKPKLDVFKPLGLAYDALKAGGNKSVVLNGANEVLVSAFLNGNIRFIDIQNFLIKVMDMDFDNKINTLEEILALDSEVRAKTIEVINRGEKC